MREMEERELILSLNMRFKEWRRSMEATLLKQGTLYFQVTVVQLLVIAKVVS